MSRARVLALLFGAGFADEAPAQDALAWRDSVQRISSGIRALQDSLLEQDSTVQEIQRRGLLVVYATSQNHARAVAALGALEKLQARWFGGASPSPDGFRIVLNTIEERGIFSAFYPTSSSQGKVIVRGLPDTGNASRDYRASTSDDLGPDLISAFSELMVGTLGSAVRSWLQHPPPLYLDDVEREYLAMYGVVTGTDRAARGCVAGVPGACAEALGLRHVPGTDPTAHFGSVVRADFLLTALEIGGSNAWSRLRSAGDASAEEALAVAAGVPSDSLLAAWQRHILSLRPNQAPLEVKPVLLAVAWTAGLLVMMLGASRWR
jgi:hypothetical protein